MAKLGKSMRGVAARSKMEQALKAVDSGRLRTKPKKELRINFRVDPDTKALLAAAADVCDMTLTEYLVECGRIAAGAVLPIPRRGSTSRSTT